MRGGELAGSSRGARGAPGEALGDVPGICREAPGELPGGLAGELAGSSREARGAPEALGDVPGSSRGASGELPGRPREASGPGEPPHPVN